MKKELMFFAAILALSLSAADPLPDLDWKVLNGKLANWSGNVEPLPDGGMVLLLFLNRMLAGIIKIP